MKRRKKVEQISAEGLLKLIREHREKLSGLEHEFSEATAHVQALGVRVTKARQDMEALLSTLTKTLKEEGRSS